MTTFGKIEEYSNGQDWSEYVERLGHYFEANEIESADKKKAILLSNLHLNPKPLVIAERVKFHERIQHDGETVNEFLAQLRKLSEHCQFGEFLNDSLRDRFVSGLMSTRMKRKLLTEVDLTLQNAVKIATGMELAEKQANELSCKFEKLPVDESKPKVHKVQNNQRFATRSEIRKFKECFR
ncbi:uncharacterized protein LOC144430410 [Styela clava]